MSFFLITSSFLTTVLIPAPEFQPGGQANGRALAYLAHQYLGSTSARSTTRARSRSCGSRAPRRWPACSTWSPATCPATGWRRDWAQTVRPLVLVFTMIAFVITILFDASVDAQGGAYATGVLVLITSAAIAVTLSCWRARQPRATIGFGLIAVVFCYATVANIVERPEGVRIAAFFIGTILVVSSASRSIRAFELRVTATHLDQTAQRLIREVADGPIRIVAHEPDRTEQADYRAKLDAERIRQNVPDPNRVIFLEVEITDPSDFESELAVRGERRGPFRVLRTASPSVPNAIAALLLHIRDLTGTPPQVYFDWSEENPVLGMLRYLLFGIGEVAPVTREILRKAEPHKDRRPVVHVG